MNASVKKVLYSPIIKITLSISICLTVLFVVKTFITKPILKRIGFTEALSEVIKNYISAIVLIFGYFILFRFYEKRKITELSTKRFPQRFIGGFVLGVSSLSLVILQLYVMGYYKVLKIDNYSYLFAPFSFLFTAALFEEIFFRLIVYRILEEWLGTFWALLLICITFTIPHLFNNYVSIMAVLTILLFSFVVSLMYSFTKQLWLPFSFHLGWNFAMPLYGSTLSGEENPGHIINAKFEGPVLFIGGKFGIEDSIFTVVILIILSIIFLYVCKRQGKILPPSRYSIHLGHGLSSQ
jgi:CAAX protease family protein